MLRAFFVITGRLLEEIDYHNPFDFYDRKLKDSAFLNDNVRQQADFVYETKGALFWIAVLTGLGVIAGAWALA